EGVAQAAQEGAREGASSLAARENEEQQPGARIAGATERWRDAARRAFAAAEQARDAAKAARDQARAAPEARDDALRESEHQTALAEARAALQQFEGEVERAHDARAAV